MKILFVCSQNRCASILSEAIANYADDPRLQAASVASEMITEVDPMSLQYLQESGIPTTDLKSKSWDELQSFHPDVVVSVGEDKQASYPQWLANSIKLHWGLDDPSAKQGTAEQIKASLLYCLNDIICRTHQILDLDLDNLTPVALKQEFLKLGAHG
ncbi:arsenate reductase ArsC [Oceaniserpentilla sp. 4NH20-0058]|uniref:arsenate reductase/protein-tyrosine-phosphatase family protein n=1 Tax=Oceaniserpentilla sp. 4NH20-0058 TaxID=3127660 RepID=UPI0031026B8F